MSETQVTETTTEPATTQATTPEAMPDHTPHEPVSFSWDSPLPSDDLPSDLSSLKGKNWNDLLAAHRELRKGVSKKGEEVKGLQAQIEELNGSIANLKDKNGAAELGTKVSEALGRFYKEGKVDPDAAGLLRDHLGLSEQLIGKLFTFMGHERTAFFQRAAGEIGDDATPETVAEIVEWVAGESSPYSHEEIVAFERAADRGDAWFIRGAAEQYQSFLQAGGQRPSAPELTSTPMNQDQTPRGTRPTTTASGDHFQSRKEYRAALNEAELQNDPSKRREVRDKLTRTPERILNSEAWLQ